MKTATDIDLRVSAIDASWRPVNEQYALYLIVSARQITGVIYHIPKKKFVYLKHFVSSEKWQWTKNFIAQAFPFEYPAHTKIFIESNTSMLIPGFANQPSSKEKLFSLSHKLNDKKLFSNPMKKLDASLVYTLGNDELNWVYQNFVDAEVLNYATPWLEMLINQYKGEKEPRMHIDFTEGAMQIAAFNDGELVLFNSFNAKTPEDKLYYALFVSEQLKFNPKKDSYYFSGAINRNDEIHIMLRSYLRESKMQGRPSIYNYSLPFHGIGEHQFFKAYCTPLCAL
ncbi:MAG: DUF3822 family protein [Bacteroidetes bacterium]|nr:DUF3822 family protein [Bacteroidota bacterium]